jgi:hypothetical protein
VVRTPANNNEYHGIRSKQNCQIRAKDARKFIDEDREESGAENGALRNTRGSESKKGQESATRVMCERFEK